MYKRQVYANENADRVIPVDVLRNFEKEGKIGSLHHYWYAKMCIRDRVCFDNSLNASREAYKIISLMLYVEHQKNAIRIALKIHTI